MATAIDERTTLAKSDRTDRETFYWLTMDTTLSKVLRMGVEMTEEEFRSSCEAQGISEHEATRWIENARKMNP